ncbi:MAG: flagellar FliJ family protein [Spirochaetales bacterium]|uniref:Flagellar FliJ protein n=1 Tax=Candidatus Thalassospirochaeta sargassi TaxID=3119039 RepID=A0AAJ1MPX9_9SPIO|nr:flagellar FliJ family protein [Spirochaetales bacterium]
MKKFQFNLQRLLNLREHEEHEWEIKLGQAVTECVRIEGEIKNRTSEIDRVLRTRGAVDGREDQLLAMELYKRRMKFELIELGDELKRAESKRDEIRGDFLEVSRNRKVLSRLKEKREAEYYKDQLKKEHDQIDEINNARAAGRSML